MVSTVTVIVILLCCAYVVTALFLPNEHQVSDTSVYRNGKLVDARSDFISRYTARVSLLSLWPTLSKLPFGPWLCNFMLGLMIPCAGTIGCKIQELFPGHVKIRIKDSWHIRDFNGRADPGVLVTMSRITSMLALASVCTTDLVPKLDGIMVSYTGANSKGHLTAECLTAVPQVGPHQSKVSVTNSAGEAVGLITCFWNLTKVYSSNRY